MELQCSIPPPPPPLPPPCLPPPAADYFGLQHIASGDLVRDEMKKGTEMGRQVGCCVEMRGFP